MTNSTLIGKVYMNCPICDKSHEVEERQHIAKIIIKDDEIEYKEEYFYCPNVADDEENKFGINSNNCDGLNSKPSESAIVSKL